MATWEHRTAEVEARRAWRREHRTSGQLAPPVPTVVTPDGITLIGPYDVWSFAKRINPASNDNLFEWCRPAEHGGTRGTTNYGETDADHYAVFVTGDGTPSGLSLRGITADLAQKHAQNLADLELTLVAWRLTTDPVTNWHMVWASKELQTPVKY